MGQYHVLVNLDKKEFVFPHKLGDGLKAWEQAANGPGGIGSALILLLVCPEPRGGGDFDENEFMGRWHGNRVALIGDYAEDDDLPESDKASMIYDDISNQIDGKDKGWNDISIDVRSVLARELGLVYRPPDYAPDDWNSWLRRYPANQGKE